PGGGTGNGGQLFIDTDSLYVRDGGQISAGTFGFGNSGNLQIDANLVEVTGSFGSPGAGGPSSLRSASERPWAGAGGILTINANLLRVADGGQVGTVTVSAAPAGNLTVRASNVEISGGDAFGNSGLFAGALFGPGSGGNLTVEAGNITVRDGAKISVSNNPSSSSSPIPSGRGPAGNLSISAQNVLLDNGGVLSADTVNGDRANITVEATTLTLRDSRITTNATGTATGGNIALDTRALTLLGDSTISANSVFSFGGRVIINAEVLLRSAISRITATSALGPEFDGIVEINNPNTPPSDIQAEEETPVETRQIIAACEQLTESELVVTGRGGLPADPTQILTGQELWSDFRGFGPDERLISSSSQIETSESVASPELNQAQGWVRDEQGQMMLVAQPTTSSDLALGYDYPSLCSRG
ncbi:filamentous hemagglutinin, partial [filamentous cyanobacterium CCP5]